MHGPANSPLHSIGHAGSRKVSSRNLYAPMAPPPFMPFMQYQNVPLLLTPGLGTSHALHAHPKPWDQSCPHAHPRPWDHLGNGAVVLLCLQVLHRPHARLDLKRHRPRIKLRARTFVPAQGCMRAWVHACTMMVQPVGLCAYCSNALVAEHHRMSSSAYWYAHSH